MTRRRAALILAATALALGAACLAYGGTRLPLRGVVRGHLGDVTAAAFVYALLALALPAPPAVRAAITAALALAVEVAQRRGDPGGGAPGELVLGAHFDPWDLAAYALGIAASLAWERRACRAVRTSPCGAY
jgi:hypothetical protein